MLNLTYLKGIQLVPVVELEPSKFSTQARQSPSDSGGDVAEAWSRYWTDSLADSGITRLLPLYRGSWHVPTRNFESAINLQRFLERTIEEWGGIDSLLDPECRPVLNGGFVLECSASDVLIAPGCCADLNDLDNWRKAAGHRGAEWQMLWIGHPFLSVRYEAPGLILSDLHESQTPVDRYSIDPEELSLAVECASAELRRFAGELTLSLHRIGCGEESVVLGRQLAGLNQ